MLAISVLGAVEVRRDGRLLAIPAGKPTELLVRLALDAGAVVRADRLVDDLWAEGALTTRRNTLQSKVATLRKALGDPSLVVSSDGGYRLAVGAEEVDALVAADDAERAARLVAEGEDRAAAELCASALPMFNAELLLGAGDGEWVEPQRARLGEIRLALVETGLGARLRLGEIGPVIAEAEAAVVADPYCESLWAILIAALYRAGRQADALAAYGRIRRRLAEDLGLDPGPGLRQLEQQVLAHDGALAEHRPAPLLAGRGGNLPSLAVELIGRDAELIELGELVRAQRLVVVVGSGGIGKTALAIAAGRRQDVVGGVWLVRLETAVSADDVIDALIAALDVTGGDAALLERLRSSETLLILDNCEHVVDAVADLAVRLLDAAPRTRILCTSQVPLDVDGETSFELMPLGLDASVELFTRRARAQRRNQNVDAALTLCRSLDGLPLAIELAAARTKTLSIEEITRRLDDRFDVLSDPTSRRPERRRALRRRSGGATSCSSPTTSVACGHWPRSPAARPTPRSNTSSPLSACRRRPRSTSSAGSPDGRW